MEITLICVGRMKEKFYIDAAAEYIKRLGAYCRISVKEVPEATRSRSTAGETAAALQREGGAITAAIPHSAGVIAMCIEGRQMSSDEFAGVIEDFAGRGISKLCFIIGGSDGLHQSVKDMAALRMSMSPMTFPHHLARVMLLEQIYRAFTISNGGKYHK